MKFFYKYRYFLVILLFSGPHNSNASDAASATSSFFNGLLQGSSQTIASAQNLLKQPSTSTISGAVGGQVASTSSTIAGSNPGLLGSLVSGVGAIATGVAAGTGSKALSQVVGQVSNTATAMISGNTSFAEVTQKLLRTKQVATAAAMFLVNLPTALLNVIQNFNYNDQVFQILSPMQTEAGQNFGIEIDFGFPGSGDISQPITFVLSNGKFFYKSIKVRFIPEPFLAKDSTGEVIPMEGIDIFAQPYSNLIKEIASHVPTVGAQGWAYLNRIRAPQAIDIYIFKIILLVITAARNETNNSGYPRLINIPSELLTIGQRLAKTPDIEACIARFPGIRDTSLWDPLKMVYIQTDIKSTLNSLPSFIKSKLDQITLSIGSDCKQEMLDMQGKELPAGFELYGKIRSTDSYDLRSALIKSEVTDFLTKKGATSTVTEVTKLANGILIHLLERLDWIYKFLFMQFVDLSKGNIRSVNASTDVSDINLELAATKLSLIDHTVFLKKINESFSNLEEAIGAVLPPLTSCAKVRQEIIDCISQQAQLLQWHKNELSNIVLDAIKKALLVTNQVQTFDDFKASYIKLKEHFDEFCFVKKTELVENIQTSSKEDISFSKWIEYWMFKLERLSFTKFDGDRAYFKDDSQLSVSETINHFMAISIRAAQDIAKATALFKNDSTTLRDFEENGIMKKMSCKEIYTKTVDQPLTLLTQRKDELRKLLETPANAPALLKPTPAKIELAQTNINTATEIQNIGRLRFLSHIKQYLFDRRDTSGIFSGAMFDPTTIAKIEKDRNNSSEQSIANQTREWILKYNLTGPNAKVRISALEDIARLKAQLAIVTDKATIESYNVSIASNKGLLETYQKELAEISPVITQLQQKMNTNIDQATKDQMKGVFDTLTARKDLLTTSISKATALLSSFQQKLSDSQKSTSEYNDIISQLENIARDQNYKDLSPRATVIVRNQAWAKTFETVTAKTTDPIVAGTLARLYDLASQGRIEFFLKTMSSLSDMDSILIDGLCTKINSALGLSFDSPTTSSITNSKAAAVALYGAIENGQKTIDSVTQDFIAQENIDSKKLAELRGKKTVNFWITLSRAFLYGLKAIASSPIGPDFESFLQKNDCFKNKTLSNAFTNTSTSASALQAAQMFLSSSAEQEVYDPAIVTNCQNFISTIDTILSNDALWVEKNWTPSFLSNLSVLPLDTSERFSFIQGALTAQLSQNLQTMSLGQEIRYRLVCAVYLFTQYFQEVQSGAKETVESIHAALVQALIKWNKIAQQQAVSIPAATAPTATSPTTTLVQTTSPTIISGSTLIPLLPTAITTTSTSTPTTISPAQGSVTPPASTTQTTSVIVQDLSAKNSLNQAKEVLYWLSKNMKYLMFYYKYLLEVNTKTSVEQFLIKEIAALSIRNSQVSVLLSENFDPFLVNVFGVNSKMLLDQSQDQIANTIKQGITSNAQIFAGIDKYSTLLTSSLEQAQANAVGTINSNLEEVSLIDPSVKAEEINKLQQSLQAMIGSTPSVIRQMYTTFSTGTTNALANGIVVPNSADLETFANEVKTAAANTALQTFSATDAAITQAATRVSSEVIQSAATAVKSADATLSSTLNVAAQTVDQTLTPYLVQQTQQTTLMQ